ncbi:MAG: hypothetical protein M1495_12470 [Bacteroidetes bacterium]|nr:hypothetical protein [Bacteroidota bacterium]MCL6098581.1 hypothetical protein [Bacteroidota bacterium]
MVNLVFFISLIVVVILISKIYSTVINYRTQKKLSAQWGAPSENRLDMESSRFLFDLEEKKELERCYLIDDNTWTDLDMDEFFKTIDRTVTPIGAQCLYNILRKPLLSQSDLVEREKLISAFSNDSVLREKIQMTLSALSKPYVKYLVYSLYTSTPEKPKYTFVFYLLSAMALWLLLFSILGFVHWGFVFVIFVIHSIIVFLYRKKLNQFLATFQYLAVLIKTTAKVSSQLRNSFPGISEELAICLQNTRSIEYSVFSLQVGEENPIAAYFNIYLLSQITGFYSALNRIKSNIESLRRMFETIGYLDAMMSVASYRKQFPNFCHPILNTNNLKFELTEIYHPLLSNPVSNKFNFESRNILITGSNMSGKSTFLKTIGINAVLAQSFNMSTSKKYDAPFLRIISSIDRSENLMTGKSYYMTEVESILRIVNASRINCVHLFIIDEIFRGTNSIERTAASIEVLKYLVNEKDFTILATHDLQLTAALNASYKNFHFREEMTETGLHFDYKLHVGTTTSKNAIALLEYVGYPQSIVDGARSLIKNN